MMMGNNKGGHVIIDRAEEPNANQSTLPDYNSTHAKRRGGNFRPTMGLFVVGAVLSAGACLFLYAVVAPVLEEWRYWVAVNGDLFRVVFLVLVVSATGAALFSFYAVGRWLHSKAKHAAIVRLQNDMPVALSDVMGGWKRPQAAQVAMWSLEQHYEVQGRWADHSGMRGLGQYAPSLHMNGGKADGAAPDLALLPGDTANDVAPVVPAEWLRWVDEAPHILLAAETGGGKSTTARKILEPRITAGEDLFIIDPHSSQWFDLPTVGGGENWPQVRAALETVYDEYRRRLDERDAYNRETGAELPLSHFKRLTVLLDEANITRAALDNGKRSEVTPWARFAKTLGSGARKVRISVVLLAQSANVEDLGLSGPMRENFTRVALDSATIRRMLDTEEKDAQRRKAMYAAVAGREYPAAMERGGRVYLLSREGVQHTSITGARHCMWAMGYEAMQGRAGASTTPLSGQSIGHSVKDKAIIAAFRKGATYEQVRAFCKRNNITIDQNRLPELRQIAIGGE